MYIHTHIHPPLSLCTYTWCPYPYQYMPSESIYLSRCLNIVSVCGAFRRPVGRVELPWHKERICHPALYIYHIHLYQYIDQYYYLNYYTLLRSASRQRVGRVELPWRNERTCRPALYKYHIYLYQYIDQYCCLNDYTLLGSASRQRVGRVEALDAGKDLSPGFIYIYISYLFISIHKSILLSINYGEHAGSGSGGSKPFTQGKNLSPGFLGEQHWLKRGALSEPSMVQKGERW